MERSIVQGARRIRASLPSAAWALLLLAGAAPLAAGPAHVQLNAGLFGIANDHGTVWRYGLEYRHRPLGSWQLRPAAGVVMAENDARFYFVGLRRDFPLGEHWLLTPSFDVTSYDEGRGIDLGSELEFRSGLEVSYRTPRDWRLGLAVYHLSNAGLGDRNPGNDSVVLGVAIPLGAARW